MCIYVITQILEYDIKSSPPPAHHQFIVSLYIQFTSLRFPFILRVVQEERQASVPWPRQCWKNNAPAHAPRRQARTTRADATSKYIRRFDMSSHLQSISCFLLHRLSKVNASPFSSASEELTIAGMTFTTFDLGGHTQGRSKNMLIDALGGVWYINADTVLLSQHDGSGRTTSRP